MKRHKTARVQACPGGKHGHQINPASWSRRDIGEANKPVRKRWKEYLKNEHWRDE